MGYKVKGEDTSKNARGDFIQSDKLQPLSVNVLAMSKKSLRTVPVLMRRSWLLHCKEKNNSSGYTYTNNFHLGPFLNFWLPKFLIGSCMLIYSMVPTVLHAMIHLKTCEWDFKGVLLMDLAQAWNRVSGSWISMYGLRSITSEILCFNFL